MLNNEPMSYPDFIKLFNFLDSETIAAMDWIKLYSAKQGVFLELNPANIESVKVNLVQILTSQGRTQADIELFARKMGNAWRMKKHRQSKGVVSLSVSLDKTIAAKLAQMCSGQTQAEVITQLVTGNYEEFLTQKNELKAKLAEEKIILKAKQASAKFEKMENKLAISAQQPTSPSDNEPAQTEELRNGIASLFDLIFTAHEQGSKIDEQLLLKATKIYYGAFAK
ncbi:hypothetical protein [Shewanella baltica]|uniref:hypothetical protein n=1 Tax=Shewanella baltica TaxID=62322 RepID=UPI00217D0ECB|nr:hypothetical protein [Shewanella baltica]MCS6178908.1 hypothetical protein [Shewanella baltica]MCS6255072.1 hypothetical protein [Shewanella baltica]